MDEPLLNISPSLQVSWKTILLCWFLNQSVVIRIGQRNCGYNTWTCLPFFEISSELHVQVNRNLICKQLLACSLTSQQLVTTTRRSRRGCAYSRWTALNIHAQHFPIFWEGLARCEKIGHVLGRFIYRFGHRTNNDEKYENGNQIE